MRGRRPTSTEGRWCALASAERGGAERERQNLERNSPRRRGTAGSARRARREREPGAVRRDRELPDHEHAEQPGGELERSSELEHGADGQRETDDAVLEQHAERLLHGEDANRECGPAPGGETADGPAAGPAEGPVLGDDERPREQHPEPPHGFIVPESRRWGNLLESDHLLDVLPSCSRGGDLIDGVESLRYHEERIPP